MRRPPREAVKQQRWQLKGPESFAAVAAGTFFFFPGWKDTTFIFMHLLMKSGRR